ncbi:STAS domain-containing protein [Streptomyces sp. Rer75]|uniref:STAS domain-containing protein n=1 Tax=unclassified Streptomyces TaxID=2593676 RepID=UPI0015D01859|nr:STAS domain-containing protein [Streptomyces sp. Rer75]QLH19770.1 STAS domain-containing protein [Streptomyces sp. Rer75]
MAGPEPESPPPALPPAVLVLDRPPETRAEVERLCARLGELVRHSTPGPVIVDVGAAQRPVLAMVETLARLRLTARRLGREMRLRNTGGELAEVLARTGLDEVLTAPATLRIEPGGEAEEGEQPLGVQERVEPGDAPG